MSRFRRRHMAASLLKTPHVEQQQLLDRVRGRTLAVRIFPGPPVSSPIVYARVWYELTGQRQWFVAPTLEPLS